MLASQRFLTRREREHEVNQQQQHNEGKEDLPRSQQHPDVIEEEKKEELETFPDLSTDFARQLDLDQTQQDHLQHGTRRSVSFCGVPSLLFIEGEDGE